MTTSPIPETELREILATHLKQEGYPYCAKLVREDINARLEVKGVDILSAMSAVALRARNEAIEECAVNLDDAEKETKDGKFAAMAIIIRALKRPE